MLLKVFILLFISGYSAGGSMPVVVPGYLGIYYGYPSLVQGSNGNLVAACNWFKNFNLLTFGDQIWNTSHSDHNNTVTIIKCLNTGGTNTKVCGYIDLGVNSSTQNLSQSQMQLAVNGWQAMGVACIFWDDAGYDYGVSRNRQNTMIQYCHSKNLSVIMNAWNPDDVMGGANVTMNSKDLYLSESFLVGNYQYQSLSAWKTKADKCANYQATLGVQIGCLATTNSSDEYDQAWFGAAMYNCNYFQATDWEYSSYGPGANILNFNVSISTSYGTAWVNNVTVNGGGTNYTRKTNANWTLNVVGDGASWGYGTFSQ